MTKALRKLELQDKIDNLKKNKKPVDESAIAL